MSKYYQNKWFNTRRKGKKPSSTSINTYYHQVRPLAKVQLLAAVCAMLQNEAARVGLALEANTLTNNILNHHNLQKE